MFQDKNHLFKLWYHENCRVYQDRLVNDADRQWFDSLLRKELTEVFTCEPDTVLGEGPILYGDFMGGSDVKVYENITDMVKVP